MDPGHQQQVHRENRLTDAPESIPQPCLKSKGVPESYHGNRAGSQQEEDTFSPVFVGPGIWLVPSILWRKINSVAWILSWSHCDGFCFLSLRSSEGCSWLIRGLGKYPTKSRQEVTSCSRGHLHALTSMMSSWVMCAQALAHMKMN